MHDPSDAASPPAGAPARRVWAEVFGCQMNKLDAQISLEAFLRAGYRPASSADEADVVVFFTCAVRQHAEDRVFSRLGKYARAKRARPDLAVVFAGCVAEEHGAQLLARFPFLDVVCGTRHFPSLPDLVASARAGGPVTAVGEGPAVYDRRSHLDPRPAAAYVSVMRGCSLACAY